TSGVPQSDHLSTLLFNIFINEILNVINSLHIYIFMDDLKLVKIINSHNNASGLQNYINNIQTWCSINHLLLIKHR
ncbi:Uncharacterized protein FWK35_00003034, partial [Aphis craccivora]